MAKEKKSWWRNAMEKVEGQIETQQAAKAEREQEYGREVASRIFGGKWVHIYANGFVQVRDALSKRTSAPFERLMAIDTDADVTKKSGLGRGAAAVMTGGINLMGSNKRGDVYLTIVTDTKTHSLRATPPTAENMKASKALEAAGKAVIGGQTSQQAVGTVAAPAAGPDALDQLKKLADLHEAGVLTDEEFAAKKADLLGRM